MFITLTHFDVLPAHSICISAIIAILGIWVLRDRGRRDRIVVTMQYVYIWLGVECQTQHGIAIWQGHYSMLFSSPHFILGNPPPIEGTRHISSRLVLPWLRYTAFLCHMDARVSRLLQSCLMLWLISVDATSVSSHRSKWDSLGWVNISAARGMVVHTSHCYRMNIEPRLVCVLSFLSETE